MPKGTRKVCKYLSQTGLRKVHRKQNASKKSLHRFGKFCKFESLTKLVCFEVYHSHNYLGDFVLPPAVFNSFNLQSHNQFKMLDELITDSRRSCVSLSLQNSTLAKMKNYAAL